MGRIFNIGPDFGKPRGEFCYGHKFAVATVLQERKSHLREGIFQNVRHFHPSIFCVSREKDSSTHSPVFALERRTLPPCSAICDSIAESSSQSRIKSLLLMTKTNGIAPTSSRTFC